MSSTSIYILLQHKNIRPSLARRYINFIESCKSDDLEYQESHHILPTSIYPEFSNLRKNRWNCKKLSARQHFIAHCMLSRLFNKNTSEFFSMTKAFNMMACSNGKQQRYINSKLYEQNRKHMSSTMSELQHGKNNSQSGTCWITSNDLKIKRKIKLDQINEYYEQGWFISRWKIPYRLHRIIPEAKEQKQPLRRTLATVKKVRVLHIIEGTVLFIPEPLIFEYNIEGYVIFSRVKRGTDCIRLTKNSKNLIVPQNYVNILLAAGWRNGYTQSKS